MKAKRPVYLGLLLTFTAHLFGKQPGSEKDSLGHQTPTSLKFNLNSSGSNYIQATLLNQVWLRYNQSNPGTLLFQKNAPNTFDVGLRRTRIQLFGQINSRTFIYFQFGQNNFNNTAGYNTGTRNRKIAAFFHDALCELKVSKGNQLKLGAGLTVLNGLSRFSQPSIGTIVGMDVPVFLQYSVDQIDQFDRRLAVYARGQLKKLDYRFYVSNPFPVGTNGLPTPPLGSNATFVNPFVIQPNTGPGVHNQFGTYLSWNFFDNEPHTTPYMAGTYLGKKKVFNVAFGAVYQKHAMWRIGSRNKSVQFGTDTLYEDMLHLGLEVFLDKPINKEKHTAFNACWGLYVTNYGKNYLRYNGLMNPGTASSATNLVQSGDYGNAFPMFGTGKVAYVQGAYLMSEKLLGAQNGQLMPYLSAQYADYFALENKPMLVVDAGLNWLLQDHHSKLSLNFQNRPTYYQQNGHVKPGARKGAVILQYQVFF